ncbi:MAG: PaaI family thioesterase [Acidimicrobiales bacterium]
MSEPRGPTGVDLAYPAWGPPRQMTIAWHDPLPTARAGAELNGLEFLEAIRDGRFPPPPIAVLLDFTLVEVEVGRVVFECAPRESAYNPIGVVHGGLACTLADTVSACAVHSTLSSGVTYTSIDLHVSYLRPITTDSGVLRATGRATKTGRRVGFATAEIVDGAGHLVATATTSCLIIDR